jgi:ASPIC and UnbV/FG-GAP-like repeat/Ig-like domain CHU_C associated/Secretion system C-terminal sorting domain
MNTSFRFALFSLVLAHAHWCSAQFVAFSNANSGMASQTHSGGCMGVVDMNGDGRDDLAKLDESLRFIVDYRNSNGTFTSVDYGLVSADAQWGMAIGDVGNDGHKDLLCGGAYDGVHYLRIAGFGNSSLDSLDQDLLFMQGCNVADVDNDGWADFFGCHDDGESRIWMNDGSGNLAFATPIDLGAANGSEDGSGNYGSTWSDFDNDNDLDLYISKCRQFVNDPTDPRRINQLWVNDGNGTYTEQAVAYGVAIGAQSWCSDLGDVDNDGDLDLFVANHDVPMQLLLNDGTGHFEDYSQQSGVDFSANVLQALFRDLDNDGFLDLITTGSLAGNAHRVFKGAGNGSFAEVENVFPSGDVMHTMAIGDLDGNGFLDVFAGYGDGYINPSSVADILWLNQGNNNHWLNVVLVGTESNRDAIGGRTYLYGPWGVQTREVRAGESYGIVNSFTAHFGLGNYNGLIDSLVVQWPSGLREVFPGLAADQQITVIENECISPAVQITGPTVLCSGGSVQLTASSGLSYEWSNGATTQSITVTAAGDYSVRVNDGSGCFGTGSVIVVLEPDQTPSIVASGPLRFCQGQDVWLASTGGTTPTWNNGAQGASILVAQSGSYTVTVQGDCQAWTSAPVVVEVFAQPAPPLAADAEVASGTSADLLATGADSVVWYAAATGGSPLASTAAFTTLPITQPTSFWCEAVATYGDPDAFGGPEEKDALGSFNSSSENHLVFEATKPFRISSVLVYANGAAQRSIALVDQGTGETVAEGTYNVPNGPSRIQLDFVVPESGEYSLRRTSANAQLWRDGLGSTPAYPFLLGTFGSIIGTSLPADEQLEYYYCFYDWEVADIPEFCSSEREEVVVDIISGASELGTELFARLSPNPASGSVAITFTTGLHELQVQLMDATGRLVGAYRATAGDLAAGKLDVSLASLSPGAYMVRSHSGGHSSTYRLVVQ